MNSVGHLTCWLRS